MIEEIIALVDWPAAPLTNSLVLKALSSLESKTTTKTLPPSLAGKTLQWSSYDSMDHLLSLEHPETVLSSSYTFRKSLIRKHFLARTIRSYTTKNPTSSLSKAVPQSWEIEINFVDELDEMWTDELYDLGEILDAGRWCILKPGMADRGNGIRIFGSKDALQRIFEEFEENSSEEEDEYTSDTAVVTSQLRHFVIQEYLPRPMLLDPANSNSQGQGHKFHLRAYVVANGALTLYLYTRILALFSAVPYVKPFEPEDASELDLAPHLTNTSLQTDCGEAGVYLLDELVGLHILSAEDQHRRFSIKDVLEIQDQMSEILSETFKAALENPVHFQAIPNAFELFGVDFMITTDSDSSALQVHLLELNAEPAIELTGPRLTWILEDLFTGIGQVIVDPFFGQSIRTEPWVVGESIKHFRKCLETQVRGSW